ncbi:hypothetical protein I317_03364 [Kwoniella heveanensis CBS 569]|nr:hypothetical protein I317_03364 [Kwoniella heveanensis CBS 569]
MSIKGRSGGGWESAPSVKTDQSAMEAEGGDTIRPQDISTEVPRLSSINLPNLSDKDLASQCNDLEKEVLLLHLRKLLEAVERYRNQSRNTTAAPAAIGSDTGTKPRAQTQYDDGSTPSSVLVSATSAGAGTDVATPQPSRSAIVERSEQLIETLDALTASYRHEDAESVLSPRMVEPYRSYKADSDALAQLVRSHYTQDSSAQGSCTDEQSQAFKMCKEKVNRHLGTFIRTGAQCLSKLSDQIYSSAVDNTRKAIVYDSVIMSTKIPISSEAKRAATIVDPGGRIRHMNPESHQFASEFAQTLEQADRSYSAIEALKDHLGYIVPPAVRNQIPKASASESEWNAISVSGQVGIVRDHIAALRRSEGSSCPPSHSTSLEMDATTVDLCKGIDSDSDSLLGTDIAWLGKNDVSEVFGCPVSGAVGDDVDRILFSPTWDGLM